MSFEYTTFSHKDLNKFNDIVNGLGKEGWELVSVVGGFESGFIGFLKRPYSGVFKG